MKGVFKWYELAAGKPKQVEKKGKTVPNRNKNDCRRIIFCTYEIVQTTAGSLPVCRYGAVIYRNPVYFEMERNKPDYFSNKSHMKTARDRLQKFPVKVRLSQSLAHQYSAACHSKSPEAMTAFMKDLRHFLRRAIKQHGVSCRRNGKIHGDA